MVCGAHDKLRAACNLAEFSDDQFIAECRVVEQYVVLLELGRSRFVVVIGVISDRDIRRLYHVFYETGGLKLVRKYVVRIRKLFFKKRRFFLSVHVKPQKSSIMSGINARFYQIVAFSHRMQ